MSFGNQDLSKAARRAAKEANKTASDVSSTVRQGGGLVAALSAAGLRSEYAYAAGFAAIGLSYVSYFASRAKKGDDKAQSDRWGIFVGHWAPTFFALGIALKLEETS